MVKAIYPGTFDPITRGHLDVIRRSSKLFEYVDVVVGQNPRKHTMFSVEERVRLIKACVKGISNVKISAFSGLTVEYLKKTGSQVIIRGLRAVSDFEYEFQMALINKKLSPKCETVYLVPSENYTYLNSSIVKELSAMGGKVSDFVTPNVEKALYKKLRHKCS